MNIEGPQIYYDILITQKDTPKIVVFEVAILVEIINKYLPGKSFLKPTLATSTLMSKLFFLCNPNMNILLHDDARLRLRTWFMSFAVLFFSSKSPDIVSRSIVLTRIPINITPVTNFSKVLVIFDLIAIKFTYITLF